MLQDTKYTLNLTEFVVAMITGNCERSNSVKIVIICLASRLPEEKAPLLSDENVSCKYTQVLSFPSWSFLLDVMVQLST